LAAVVFCGVFDLRNIAGAKRPGLVKKMGKVIRDKSLLKVEKQLEKIRRQIVQRDKRQRRTLKYIDLAIERLTTGAATAELAKRHHLTEGKVRRYIDRAVLLARSRMLERK
jgi:hypothetical protein